MNKILISGDSSWDLPKELLGERFQEIPTVVILGDKEYLDGVNLTVDDIYEYAERTGRTPTTAATPPVVYEEFFDKHLKAGYDGIIHIALSSGISSCCDNAKEAAGKFKNVYAVDSRSLSSGLALAALYARDLLDEGMDVAGAAAKVKARVPNLQSSFVIDKMEFLHKGGRCSGLARFAASLLKIKPTIAMEHKMSVGKKYIGMNIKAALNKYVDDTFERCPDPDLTRIFITYSVISADIIEMVKRKIEKKFKFREIVLCPAGSTITSHCGKNTLGILYFNN